MIAENAPAKLNLALHVRRRRDDGYHELETVFAFCQHGDELHIEFAPQSSLTITGPFAAGLSDEGDNLVTRAVAAFDATFGTSRPVTITLDKRLPVASGIGGGSADAAATLRAMARLHDVVGDPRLFSCAERLGSDVPACLLGVSATGTGRGEKLVPVSIPRGVPTLLVNPGVSVSTAAVFQRWDGIDRGAMPSDPCAGRNDLQAPATALAPVIDDVITAIQDGASFARMSGSGATCFALYDSVAARDAASTRIRGTHPDWWCLETALA